MSRTRAASRFSDDPEGVRLAQFGFRLRERFLYEYDFYDGWQHDVRLEKVLPLNSKRLLPLCTGGQRPAPPGGLRRGAGLYGNRGPALAGLVGGPAAGRAKAAVAEAVQWFIDSGGERSAIGDRETLRAALERVNAHWALRPDRLDRRAINRRLQQTRAWRAGLALL